MTIYRMGKLDREHLDRQFLLNWQTLAEFTEGQIRTGIDIEGNGKVLHEAMLGIQRVQRDIWRSEHDEFRRASDETVEANDAFRARFQHWRDS